MFEAGDIREWRRHAVVDGWDRKECLNELIDADLPGGAIGGRRRSARRRGFPAARKHQEAAAAVQNIQDSLMLWTRPRGRRSLPG